MKYLTFWMALILFVPPLWAQSVDGRWIFDKATDFENTSLPAPAPSSLKLEVENTQAKLTANCSVSLRQQPYYPGGPFQALLKSGQDEQAIEAFLSKQFSFRLTGNKFFYAAESGGGCNKVGSYFLVSDDKLVAIRGGVLFYAYKRDPASPQVAAPPPSNKDEGFLSLGEIKISPLPFNLEEYNTRCLANWPKRKGVPQSNSKCSSNYNPYVVSRDTKGPLLALVGTHAYVKGGARGAGDDYDNPTSHGLHPIAVIFPPLRNVVLVRVDDLEGGGDSRDAMSGAYLAIKDGKVTGQLNEGCSFDANYVCSTLGESSKFKLLETGKFIRVN